MTSNRIRWLLPLLLGGCVDAQPTTPDFEQRVFSILGGLSVGEALTMYGEAAQSIVLQGGERGARYVFIPFLAAEEGSVRLRVRVSGEALEDPGLPDAVLASAAVAESEARDDERAHLALREWERQRAEPFLRDPTVRVQSRLSRARWLSERATVVPAIGEVVPLRVPNRDPANSDLCSNPRERMGRVTAVSPHAILVEDTLNPVALTPSDAQRIMDEYETLVHPVAVANFGEPTDVDENGRVYIFVTSVLNETAQRTGGGLTVGFTFALDLLPRSSTGGGFQCPASNEGEIFYLIAPDPDARLGVTVTEELVRRLSTAIVIHELQHMINFGRRLYEVEEARSFEKVWLNEGLSHIAEELVFYAATGMRPRSDINWETLKGSEPMFDAYRRFVRDNMASYADYLDSPDDETLMGKRPDDDEFPTRGATWAFLRYLADQTPMEDADLFMALVNSPISGIENLEQVLDGDPRNWMQRWTVANYTDNLASIVAERFTQPSWNFRSIYQAEIGGHPLAPRPLAPDATISLNVRGGGASYLLLRAMPGRQARVNSARTGQSVFGELRISVVRIE